MKFDEAIRLYRQVLAGDPEMLDVWMQLAQADIRLGRSADAVDAYRHVIERDPKNGGSLIGAGSELLRIGKLDEAQKYGELAAGVAPALAHSCWRRSPYREKTRWRRGTKPRSPEHADPTIPMGEIIEGHAAL